MREQERKDSVAIGGIVGIAEASAADLAVDAAEIDVVDVVEAAGRADTAAAEGGRSSAESVAADIAVVADSEGRRTVDDRLEWCDGRRMTEGGNVTEVVRILSVECSLLESVDAAGLAVR